MATRSVNAGVSPAVTSQRPVLSSGLHGRTFPEVGNQTIHIATYESLAVKELTHALRRVNWPFVSGTCPNSTICLPRSWSQYVDRLAPGFRPLVIRYPRKLATRYKVCIRRCENVDDLKKGLELLF